MTWTAYSKFPRSRPGPRGGGENFAALCADHHELEVATVFGDSEAALYEDTILQRLDGVANEVRDAGGGLGVGGEGCEEQGPNYYAAAGARSYIESVSGCELLHPNALPHPGRYCAKYSKHDT